MAHHRDLKVKGMMTPEDQVKKAPGRTGGGHQHKADHNSNKSSSPNQVAIGGSESTLGSSTVDQGCHGSNLSL